MKSAVVVVTPELPYPPDQGGRMRMWNVIKHVTSRYDVHLVSLALQPPEEAHRAELQRVCKTVETVVVPPTRGRMLASLARSWLTGLPYMVAKHTSGELRAVVGRALQRPQVKAALLEFHWVAECVPPTDVPLLLDMHNIDYVTYARAAHMARNFLRRQHARIQTLLMHRYESRVTRRITACFTVSKVDARRFSILSRHTSISVAPNGADLAFYDEPAEAAAEKFDLLFVGTLNYFPNEDAILYLVQEIMPEVWKSKPEATVAIVGRGMTPAVAALREDARVRVVGAVADVRPYYLASKLVAMPIRVGGGTRLKAVESGAMKSAIVATRVALEGIPFEHGRNAVMHESTGELAQSIVRLLDDPAERERLGENAWELSRKLDWSYCLQPIMQALDTVCGSAADVPATERPALESVEAVR